MAAGNRSKSPARRRTRSAPARPAPDTRAALLAAAAETFAEHGYRAASVRAIALRARANVAAVNYHFGGKAQLYREVIRCGAEQKFRRHPLLPPALAGAPPEERLAGVIRGFVGRLLDDDTAALAPRLMLRELADPTAAIDAIARDIAAPQFAQVREVVAQILGPAAPEEMVRRASFSVIGQCLVYRLAHPVASRIAPELFAGAGLEARIARHVTEFSLGALRALRASLPGG